MSKANDIAAAIQVRLSGILRSNGYATDLGRRVYRGRLSIDPSTLPVCTLIEQEDQVEQQRTDSTVGGGSVDCRLMLPYVVEVTSPCDPDMPAVAGHELVADIKRAIFSGDLTWSGLCTHTQYIGRTLSPRADGTDLVTATVSFRVGMVEDLASP